MNILTIIFNILGILYFGGHILGYLCNVVFITLDKIELKKMEKESKGYK